MPDLGDKLTNLRIKQIRPGLNEIYNNAKKNVEDKLSGFLNHFSKEFTKLKAELDAGTITETEYRRKIISLLMRNDLMSRTRTIAKIMYAANSEAIETINQKIGAMIADGISREAYQAEMDTGLDYQLFPLDANDVDEWMDENPDIFPTQTIDKAKDERWNSKSITSSIVSDILIGVAVGILAKRTADRIANRNRNSMFTRAYDSLSGAYEYGRDIMIGEEARKGMEPLKEWSATLDFKTRDAHRELDGKRVPEDQPFEVDGEEIWFPRDPTAPAHLRCNCRCAMRTIHTKYDTRNSRRENLRTYYPDGTWEKKVIPYMNYDEWYEMKRQQMGDVEIQRQIKQMKREQQQRYYRKRKREKKNAS